MWVKISFLVQQSNLMLSYVYDFLKLAEMLKVFQLFLRYSNFFLSARSLHLILEVNLDAFGKEYQLVSTASWHLTLV